MLFRSALWPPLVRAPWPPFASCRRPSSLPAATAVAATTATTALLSPPPSSSPVTELVAAALLSCLDVPVWRSSLSQRTATSAPRTQRRGCKGTGPTSWSGPSVQSQPSPGTLAFPPSHGAGCPPRGASGRPWSSCLVQGHALAAPYVERVDGPDSALGCILSVGNGIIRPLCAEFGSTHLQDENNLTRRHYSLQQCCLLIQRPRSFRLAPSRKDSHPLCPR